MRVLFRADASIALGAGHIVRCATVGHHLVNTGHSVTFICRTSPGNLITWLESEGFDVWHLPPDVMDEDSDASACEVSIQGREFDWLVVDHYQLGVRWEKRLAQFAAKLLVIDDLARRHACDLLLDSSPLTRQHADYLAPQPPQCSLLLGPTFALVRPEFSALRLAALHRRRGQLERILVFMGASDPENETAKVLSGLTMIDQPSLHIDVVIGASNPNRNEVESACRHLPNSQLHVQTADMAKLMTAADCAINAGGSTTWERCTLGLPGIVAIHAENQVEVSQAVHRAGAHWCLGWRTKLQAVDYAEAVSRLTADRLQSMSIAAARICDGHGAARVSACLAQ